MNETPTAKGKLTSLNIFARAGRQALFRAHCFWCTARRKVTHRTQRPRDLGGEMLHALPISNKTVWIYWDKGWENMPPLAKLSFDSWRRKNPGWTIRFLDLPEALELTDIDPAIVAKDMLPAHLADLIRLELLTQFGGVWADATTFCVSPLDDWLFKAMPFGFFAFTVTEQNTVANWFIAAEKGNLIVKAWRDMAYSYWSCAQKATAYFMYYDLFSLAMIMNKPAGRMWKYSTRIERTQPNILRYEFLNRGMETRFSDFVHRDMIPLHKFSFRETIPEEFAGTPLAHVLEVTSADEMRKRADAVVR